MVNILERKHINVLKLKGGIKLRKAKRGCEYLELQSVSDNGFKKLNDAALKERFGAKKSHSINGVKYETKDCIIDIELLNNSADFKKLLGYINTASDKQLKGGFGFIK